MGVVDLYPIENHDRKVPLAPLSGNRDRVSDLICKDIYAPPIILGMRVRGPHAGRPIRPHKYSSFTSRGGRGLICM